MRGSDRFLIAIVAGVVLLVVVVLALALASSDEPAYLPDDIPEGVAHNYLLALQLEEYERAYRYLSPTVPGYPATSGSFERDVTGNRWSFDYSDDDVSLAVEAVDADGGKASVVVRRTAFSRGWLFDSGQSSSTFEISLSHEDGAWKITDSDRYWVYCWSRPEGCR